MATTRPKLSPAEQMARAKQKALGEGIKVWLLSESPEPRYAIPSSSEPGRAYEVICHDDVDDVSCNCPGNTYRNVCKHAAAVALRLAVENEMELAQAAAVEDRGLDITISQANQERLERELADIGL